MPEINLIDFFTFYKGTPEQKEGVQLLQSAMPDSLLRDASAWVQQYRKQPEDPGGICTPDLMHRLTGHAANTFDDVFCKDCNRLFRETGFEKHIDAMQMLMANMMHETCNFVYMKEIASGVAYNNRSDLGNGPTDGPVYKGAGVLQLTGRYNYQKLAEGVNDPAVMEGCDYVADTYPFTSAKIWIKENGLLDVCLRQGFEACCVKINGGYTGFEDRSAKYEICKREMTAS